MRNFTTRKIVGFQLVGVDRDAGFRCRDASVHDERIGHAAQIHGQKIDDAHRRVGDAGAQPEIEELGNDQEDDQSEHDGAADEEEL
jgi:hypothetical protein